MASFTHLLDTSVYSQFLTPRPIQAALDRWYHHGDAALAVSAICEAEVLYGIALNPPHAITLQQRYDNYLRRRLTVIPIDGDVAATFAKLKATCKVAGTLVPDMDLLIASTALTHNLIVATLNHRHFKLCPGVVVDDWSQRHPSPPEPVEFATTLHERIRDHTVGTCSIPHPGASWPACVVRCRSRRPLLRVHQAPERAGETQRPEISRGFLFPALPG